MKRRFFIMVALTLINVLSLIGKSSGYQIVDHFVFPINGYTDDGCLDWGGYNSLSPGKRHVGNDYCVPAGTDVLAIGNGRVKYTWRDPSGSKGWYGLIITEHTLPDGDKICSLYGHAEATEVSVGDEIVVGQKIGEIIEYPESSNHIHFGIYNGAFDAIEGVYPYWACGYILNEFWPGNYLDPIDFIESHQHHQVIKFSDSPDCYLQSNSQLWPIGSEQIFARLGFAYDCSFSANWSYLTNLDASQKSDYIIRQEIIPSVNVDFLNHYMLDCQALFTLLG